MAMLCKECHMVREHNGDSLGLVGMLALKVIYDPANYDRVHVNTLRGRAPDAISEREVARAVSEMFLSMR